MKAALYARVSTEEQVEGYSIPAQIRAFKSLCEEKGWTAYREYVEEGRSAHTENVNKRPLFKETIADGLAGKFDVLVVHKIDRFSRKERITKEYFEKLGNAGVGFFSIMEQMDFSTPWGKFALTMLGGLAELYSDNLSEETKKGKRERKAEGLYNGLLPFGAVKGDDGVPMPHPETYPGLVMAFELAAQGNSDREVAKALNMKGYRTAGNQGNRLFSGDTVGGVLTNRFYLGELPSGNGGWVDGKHEPLIGEELWNSMQEMRVRNRRAPKTINVAARTYSLSTLAWCRHCGAKMWTGKAANGRPRLYCSNQAKGIGM